jgi:hypothetical protein
MHAKGNQGLEMTDKQINEIMALVDSYANAFVSDMPRARAAIESALRAAVPAIPKCIVWDRGFRWDADRQQYIPQLIVRFDPVPFDGHSDAKGWKDRDTLAAMLSASPQAPDHTEHILGMVQAPQPAPPDWTEQTR